MSKSGKAGLQLAILSFFNANNVVSSKKFAERLADHMKRHIATTLIAEGKFALRDVGTLNVRQRAARVASNPRTGVKVKVPATKTVTFKVSRGFKSSLNKQQ